MDFNSVADDFFVNLSVQTTLALPESRETVLHFFEAVQRQFPLMGSFYRRETGEHVLEGDHDRGTYPWLELQTQRLASGYFNPPTLADAYHLHQWLLERSVYYLGVSNLDVECVDVLFGFNLDFRGNRDEIVSEALLGGSPLAALAVEGTGRVLECEPSMVVALDEECSLQARLSIETRSNSFQVRTGEYEDEPISIYLTVRQYASPGRALKLEECFAPQAAAAEDVACRLIVPQIVHPVAAAIASAR